jgi:parallel beta-helix repeat protein
MQPRWLFTLTALMAASPAAAATYTVASTGSDSNNGISAPFRTLQKAVRVLSDGDTILLQQGTYVGGAWIERRNITVRGQGVVVLDGRSATRDNGLDFYATAGITVDNLKIRYCRRMGIQCTLSSGLTIRNCETSSNAGSGILTGNTSDVVIENCAAFSNGSHGVYLSQSGDRLQVAGNQLYSNARAGLQINANQDTKVSGNASQDGFSTDCVVEKNTIYGNGSVGGAGINLMGVLRSLIVNNLLHSNLAGGIALWDDGAGPTYACKSNRLLHNTVTFASGRGRYGVQFLAGSTGNELRNNILVCGLGDAIEAEERIVSNFNCLSAPTIANGGSLATWQRATGNDLNSAQGNPGLAVDYHLLATSPARDAGYLLYNTDKNDRLRPQGASPDLGCYEELSGGSTAPPAAPALFYGDGLAAGWTALGGLTSYNLGATSPVFQGTRSLAMTVLRYNGYLYLQGPGVPVAGKTNLKFAVHGGATGGQPLAVTVYVDRIVRGRWLLSNLGGVPAANAWKQYAIPLSALGMPSGKITTLKIDSAVATGPCFLDYLRLE